MSKHKVEDIRNIALCGHGGSGKTTLADKLLMKTGAVATEHSVDAGTSVLDFDAEEKAHKRTIESSICHFTHAGKRFNLIDTPGYADFIGQTIGALRGVDTAVIVINAHSGIEVNTRRVFKEAEKAGVGRIIIINKLDEHNLNFPALIERIRDTFGNQCVLFNVPIGHGADFKGVASTLKPGEVKGALISPAEIHTSLIESIVEVDEELMMKYFEGEEPSPDQLAGLIVQAVAKGTLIPILCCSAKTGVGLAELLDGLVACSVPPSAVPHKAKKDGTEIEVKPDPAGPLVAQVFKTRIDPFVQKLSYIRVYSGTMKKDETVPTTSSRKGTKLGPLLDVQGGETKPVDFASAGEIVAIAKMEDLHTGTSLGVAELPKIDFPTPMVGMAVTSTHRS